MPRFDTSKLTTDEFTFVERCDDLCIPVSNDTTSELNMFGVVGYCVSVDGDEVVVTKYGGKDDCPNYMKAEDFLQFILDKFVPCKDCGEHYPLKDMDEFCRLVGNYHCTECIETDALHSLYERNSVGM